jgi:hypothetical protein
MSLIRVVAGPSLDAVRLYKERLLLLDLTTLATEMRSKSCVSVSHSGSTCGYKLIYVERSGSPIIQTVAPFEVNMSSFIYNRFVVTLFACSVVLPLLASGSSLHGKRGSSRGIFMSNFTFRMSIRLRVRRL